MKNHTCTKLTGLMLCLSLGIPSLAQQPETIPSFQTIENHFCRIPAEQPLAVYWYWIADNISREGVVKDLQAMKKAGITRAYIGNIGDIGVAYGKVKLFSDEWWNIMHTALKTAAELDIEIGIFNSPGWSQSGGPWIKKEESMRYLGSRQIQVEGPLMYSQKLPVVAEGAQDVRIIAYPGVTPNSAFRPAQDLSQASTIDLVSAKPGKVRSLTVQTVARPCRTPAELLVKRGDTFQPLCKFEINRTNAATNVGFQPYAPIVVSVPETEGSEFRLLINKESAGLIESVTLSDVPKIERYPEKTLAKMFQEPLPMWNEYLWKQQPHVQDAGVMVAADKVVDLTKNLNPEGTLTWNVPKGKWTIMRTAMVPTGQTNGPASPEGTGLEVDKMSARHVETHFDAFIGQILKRVPEADRRTFRIVVEDSYETGGQNWTDTMIEDFTKQYGYNPIPFLPVFQGIVVGSPDQSDRFLWDVRRLVADKVAYEYVGGLKKISNRHGLTTWLENYGHWGFPGEFLQYGGQSDEIGGEFWSVGDLGNIENRAASSCGHIYGKNKIWAESFTCGGPDFARYPGEMKQRGDRFFTEGINATLLHLFIQQPDDRVPGINAPFGNEFNRHNTWFSQFDVFGRYLKRCNYMLQQGQYVADVAYFIGEDAPKMTGVRVPEIPKGFSYDYINGEILMRDADIRDGKLTLKSGMQYRVLVLPPQTSIRPELLRKIQEMVAQGLTILGPKPTHSPSLQNYPQADTEVKRMAGELWQASGDMLVRRANYGAGKVYSNTSLEEIFADQGIVPDVQTADPCDPLLFIHRKTPQGDIYFVSNQSSQMLCTDVAFRVKGKIPELWNPQLAEIRRLTAYKELTQSTQTSLTLHPNESAFIIFRTPADSLNKAHGDNYPEKKTLAQVAGPWTVTFQEGRGGPDQPVLLNELTDWSKSSDDRIRYFSGTALYRTAFKVSKLTEQPTYIDLGNVMVMAKVKLNGQTVGGVWTTPYRLNITPYLKKGKNELEIEVVNTWVNRLIRDKSLPENEKITWQTFSYWNADSPLQSSGLLGPVEIQSYDYDMKGEL